MTELSNNHTAQQVIESDLNQIEFRRPVITDDLALFASNPGQTDRDEYLKLQATRLEHDRAENSELSRTDRQWMIVTEVARRAIAVNSEVRSTAIALAAEPLNETLPNKALKRFSGIDSRIARIAETTATTLGKRLQLDAVPDKVIVPDITHAPSLFNRQSAARSLELTVKYDPEGYPRSLAQVVRTSQRVPGISYAERKLVAQRYRYARDVKMLGLAAELYDDPLSPADLVDGVLTKELPSGIKIGLSADSYTVNPDLLDPSKWESRRQLKDRVYVVKVGGTEYIQKERKTARHTDTKKNGHRDGLTSQQEFEVAREFAGLGTVIHEDVSLKWEQSVGFVEFPDGYQFTIFEKVPDLEKNVELWKVTDEICQHKEAYKEEFNEVKNAARTIYNERDDLLYDKRFEKSSTKSRVSFIYKLRRKKPVDADRIPLLNDELSFEEFAELKARSLQEEARDLLTNTIYEKGYVNSDLDGYVITMHKGARVRMQIIGFDFEYYKKDPKWADEILNRRNQMKQSGESLTLMGGDRAIKSAAFYALREKRGMPLPAR